MAIRSLSKNTKMAVSKRQGVSKIEDIENSKGIYGFVLSIASLGLWLVAPFMSIIFSIAGIVFSVLQMKQKKLIISKAALIISIAAFALACLALFLRIAYAFFQASSYFLM